MDRPLVEILSGSEADGASTAVYLGSFDPPHRGHAWITEVLLERFESVLLLLPTVHFHKVIEPPRHATLEQRVLMLEAIRSRAPERVSVGLAREVLFLELDRYLGDRFAGSRLGFGMGDETFQRVLGSAAYFSRLGRAWTPNEDRALAALASRIIVFNRSGATPSGLAVPDGVRGLSSTGIRAEVAALYRAHASRSQVVARLAPRCPDGVADFIALEGLYAA